MAITPSPKRDGAPEMILQISLASKGMMASSALCHLETPVQRLSMKPDFLVHE